MVVDKALAMVVGTLGLSALLGLALVAEGALVGMDLPAGNVAAAMLHLALLGLVFGALALAIGAGTGRLGLSRAVPVFVAVVAYVVNGLGGLVDWLAPVQKLSPSTSTAPTTRCGTVCRGRRSASPSARWSCSWPWQLSASTAATSPLDVTA